jgi:hypothetical protein
MRMYQNYGKRVFGAASTWLTMWYDDTLTNW